jgi:cholesterol oxidase
MADSPDHGVVDANGQVFGYPGMYITDGSALSASIGMGPSLTILANAERMAHEMLN